MKHKAVALLSGGLDSTLAVRLILDQGVEVHALNFITPFCTCNRKGRCEAKRVADEFGIPIRIIALTDEFFPLLRNPTHGYGSGMNPCLDCRILMFSRAKENLEEIGADFIFTGEVLGQRPMSQHLRAMRIIDHESGLDGCVLRPLSAKLLPSTMPERQGIVQREKLLGIRGRSRKEQMALAPEYGIADYPCPAGGCRLTEPGFARRMRDLVTHRVDFDLNELNLLKVGRHFRLLPRAKTVVGRNEEENRRIRALARPDDFLFEVQTWGSPLTLVRGEIGGEEIRRVASITARYSDAPGPDVRVCYGAAGTALEDVIHVSRMGEQELAQLRI